MSKRPFANRDQDRQEEPPATPTKAARGGVYARIERARPVLARRYGLPFAPDFKRIRRWRDRRLTGLIRGRLVTHRRTTFMVRHKSKQRRHLRHQHY